MNEATKKTLQKVGIIFASLLLIAYIIYQAYMIIYDPVGTELAYEYTVEDTLTADVFVAREESYITNTRKGTIISAVSDGSRVSKNQEVALIFTETEAADNYMKLREVEEQIERYTRLSTQSDNYIFDITNLDQYIDNEVIDLVNLVEDRNFSYLDRQINDLRNQIVTRQISTGSNLDFSSKLASLNVQYESLKAKSTNHKSVVSTNSGYYVGSTDGYENVIDVKDIAKISIDDIRTALEAKEVAVPEGTIGKVISGFTWYFLCVVESNKIPSLVVGDTITVNLPFSAVNSVETTVYAINESRDTGEAALVLACNLMNSDIAQLRQESAELVITSYTGLKIPTTALRVDEDGNKGVYVLTGNIATFKKVNTIYSTDDYVLSKAEDGANGYVSLYDNIITEGRDLYDGKVIK